MSLSTINLTIDTDPILARQVIEITSCHPSKDVNKSIVQAHPEAAPPCKHGTPRIAHVHLIVVVELCDLQLVTIVREEVADLDVGVVKAAKD